MVEGQPIEVFTIGDVATAIGRSPATIRRFEREGVIPRARLRLPSLSAAGRRRLYTGAQVKALTDAALREGLHRRRNGRGGISQRFRRDALAAMQQPLFTGLASTSA